MNSDIEGLYVTTSLAECIDLLGWHSDDDADEENQSPEDQVAHINGLVRRKLYAVIDQLRRG